MIEVDIENNLLIFKVNTLVNKKDLDEIRLDIINQLREGVLVLDKRIEVMVVDKGDSKQWRLELHIKRTSI